MFCFLFGFVCLLVSGLFFFSFFFFVYYYYYDYYYYYYYYYFVLFLFFCFLHVLMPEFVKKYTSGNSASRIVYF